MAELTWIISWLIVTIVSIFYGLIKYQFTHWKRRGVPHLEPKFPWGNLSEYGKTEHATEIYNRIYYKFKDQSPYSGAYFTLIPVAILTDLNLIHRVLIKDFNYFVNRGFYYNAKDDPISAHMFSLDGDEWREVRRKFTPTFTPAKMKYMFPTVLEVAQRFIKVFDAELERNNVQEIKDYLARFTTDVIGTVAFGIECNSLQDPKTKFREIGIKNFDEPRHSKLMQVLLSLCPDFARFCRIKLNSDMIIDFFTDIVNQCVQQRETGNVRRQDFMDLLIEMKNSTNERKKINMNELAAQTWVFFLAGFETSSTAMSFALYELAKRPEVQDRARQEVMEVLKKHNNELTYEAIMDMKYLEQTINETLRKYPPLAVLTRRAVDNYKIPGTDKVFETGASLVIPVFTIHHDPALYPDPEKFDPDRFTPEEMKKRHPMSFIPFGDGPRNCIGLRFGVMQTLIGLALILKNYRIKMSDKTQNPLKFSMKSIILAPDGGVILQFDKIKQEVA